MNWPQDVGIVAIDIYFPRLYVEQSDLEVWDRVSEGKYTIGLGQKQMSVCPEGEDIVSMCLTVTRQLMRKHSIRAQDIGFLSVGTESPIDNVKSIKTHLMDLFYDCGNTDIEGLHTTNACYGGTASLFNAVNWVESSAWDGRYALVVCADIAVYDKGNVRPLGSAAAVALLVGPNAAVVFDRKVRSTYMTNVYDFYKPVMDSEYPIVEGQVSIDCYLNALKECYHLYVDKMCKVHNEQVSLQDFDAVLFHSPQCKLVQKSFAKLFYWDYLKCPDQFASHVKESFELIKYDYDQDMDKDLEKLCMSLSGDMFGKKTSPSLLLVRALGNPYTASLYTCLISLLVSKPLEQLINNRVLLYSYGSGLSATIFSARITSERSSLSALIAGVADVCNRLQTRKRVSAQELDEMLDKRKLNYMSAPFVPNISFDNLTNNSYYLDNIDDKYRRSYKLFNGD